MDVDDDEFDFGDDLDAEALAALDQIEKKHFDTPAPDPPAKRRKTESGWQPATSVAHSTSFDLDELPEISLCQNTYTFNSVESVRSPSLTPQQAGHAQNNRVPTRQPPPPPPPANNRVSLPSKTLPHPIKHPGQNAQHRPGPALNRNRSSTNRPRSARLLEQITLALAGSTPEPTQQQATTAPTHPRNPPTQQRNTPAPPPPPLQRTITTPPAPRPLPPASRNVPHIPPPRAPDPQPPRPPQPSPVPPLPATGISEELDQYKKQLEEMRAENERMKEALKQAEEASIAKGGEVSNLRRTIQKTADDHAAQVSKLKAAKDEADAKQVSMQRELKEEMERLKTQFIFKQHELESNAIKRPPMSAHVRRTIRDLPGSTQPSPFWGTSRATVVVGPSTSTGGLFPPESTPVRAMIRPQIRSPEQLRKSAILPGFENSFLESTPKRPLGKDKGRHSKSPEIHRPLFAQPALPPLRKAPTQPQPSQSAFPDDNFDMDVDVPPIPPKHQQSSVKSELFSSPTRLDNDEDVEMDGEEEDDEDEASEEEAHFNWKAELTRIVLTHAHPSCPRPTLQLLAEQATLSCSTHISRILEAISSTSFENDYERVIPIVARCLISMSTTLNLSNMITQLVPLLNLLSTLIYSLPSFKSITLQHCSAGNHNNDDTNDEASPDILVLICDLVKKQLASENHSNDTPLLSAEVLSLVESLCWKTPEETVPKLDIILSNRVILMILLDNAQPLQFLVRATRLLALMSTYPHLARSLLSVADPVPEEENEYRMLPKIPQLDRCCAFLMDTAGQDEDSVILKENVVTLFSVLSLAHPDSLAALTSSPSVIPALILYLTQLSAPIWEEEEALISSPSALSSIIKSLNQTIYLFHYLVFNLPSETGLKYMLQRAPARPFNGVAHMFIVTFGRLSYAPIPEWIDTEQTFELSAVREPARELLEVVVDGPEVDSVYTAFHDEEEDEGEMEKEFGV